MGYGGFGVGLELGIPLVVIRFLDDSPDLASVASGIHS